MEPISQDVSVHISLESVACRSITALQNFFLYILACAESAFGFSLMRTAGEWSGWDMTPGGETSGIGREKTLEG